MKSIPLIFFILLLTIGSIGKVHSQKIIEILDESGNVIEYKFDFYTFPKYSVGFTPSAFVNIYSASQISFGKSFNDGIENLYLELGYIYHIFFSVNDHSFPDYGFRLKLGYEKMINFKSGSIGGGLLMRYGVITSSMDINRNNLFRENVRYNTNKGLNGVYFSYNNHHTLSDKLDLSIGFILGFGKLRVHRYILSETTVTEAEIENEIDNIFRIPYRTSGQYFYPIIGTHINLRYRIF